MKHRHHSKQQIFQILAAADRYDGPMRQFCKENNISEQTFYRWKRQHSAVSPSQMSDALPGAIAPEMLDFAKSEKDLVRENDTLKKIIGELLLDRLNLKKELQKLSAAIAA